MSTNPSDNEATDTSSHLLSHIHAVIKRHDDDAEKLQRTRWWIGCSLIILGPAAVLASTAQFLKLCPRADLILDGLDASLLVLALFAAYWRVGGALHEKWIHERLCTELLRREYFLFGASVGPYLAPGVLRIQVESRLEKIGSRTKDLVELVPMLSEPGGPTWRDELEESGTQAMSPLPDLPSAIDYYLKHRVEDQLKWFAGRSAKHAAWASRFERAVQTILILAVALSLSHFGGSLAAVKVPKDAPPPWFLSPWFFFAGISLTVVGVGVAGFQALLENDRLSRSYAYHSARLERFASRLRSLQSNLALGKSGSQETQFRFKRIVLEVEGMFSEELMQWRLVMEPRAPRAEA